MTPIALRLKRPGRTVLGCAAAGIAVLLASGCGMGGQGPATAGSGEPVKTKITKPTTITFLHVYTGEDGKVMDSLVKKFEAANPSITVNAQFVGGFQEVSKKVVSMLQAGSAPDLAVAYPPNVADYNKSKRLLDLSPYVANTEIGLTDADRSDIFSSELQRNRYADQKGAFLSFPFTANVAVLYYNADLLREAGIDGPPKTWADFESQCAAIKAIGKLCYAANANASTLNAIGYSYGAAPMSAEGQASFSTPEWTEALGMLGRLANAGQARLSGVGDAQTADQNEFVSGQAAFIMRSSRASSFLDKAIGSKFTWSAAPIPQREATERPTTALYGPGMAAFASDPERQLASWLFIRYLASADAQTAWVTSTGNLPIRRSVQDTPEFAAYQQKRPASGVAARLVPGAHWEGSLGDDGIVAWLPQKFRNTMEDIEGGVLGGAIPSDAAQDQLQAQASQLLAR